MVKFKIILTYLLAFIMLQAGVMHFINPQVYYPFIPEFLPKEFVNYATGVVEILLGIGTILKRFRGYGTLGILLLMIAFLPLHIIDVFKENPAIGTHQLAIIRLPLQFVLIAWAWFINKK